MICPSCGFKGPGDGPTHDYLTVSPACWARYGEVMAKEYSDRAYWPSHRRLVDAYAGQHSIGSDRRARQSLWIHMAALMLAFHDEVDDAVIPSFLGRAAKSGHPFPELALPPKAHSVDLTGVHSAPDVAAHHRAVEAYARGVLAAWTPHHTAFRSLVDTVGVR